MRIEPGDPIAAESVDSPPPPYATGYERLTRADAAPTLKPR